MSDEPLLATVKDAPQRENKWQPREYDTVVIAHANCPDGVVSAWCFTKCSKLGSIYYYFTAERDFSKDVRMPSLKNKNVYIVDYAYPRDTLEKINKEAKSIKVYDHHKTNLEELKDLPYCVFDLDKCGAEITWNEIYKLENGLVGDVHIIPRPWFFKHIRDRDLFEWKHQDSRAFGAALQRDGLRLHVIEKYAQMTPKQQQELFARGRTILACEKAMYEAAADRAEKVTIDGLPAYALNIPIWQTECGEELYNRDPKIQIAIMYSYSIADDMWRFSMRALKTSNVDLSVIAKRYGGGGHPTACGFTYKGALTDIIKIAQ